MGQVYRSYSTAVKLCWGLPRDTHTWLVSHLLGCGLPTAREDPVWLPGQAGDFGQLGGADYGGQHREAGCCLSHWSEYPLIPTGTWSRPSASDTAPDTNAVQRGCDPHPPGGGVEAGPHLQDALVEMGRGRGGLQAPAVLHRYTRHHLVNFCIFLISPELEI